MPLPLLRRQSAHVAYQKMVRPHAKRSADRQTRAFELGSIRRVQPVIHAPHTSGISYTTRDREPRHVVRNCNDQVLPPRKHIVHHADEWIEEETVVVVARRDQKGLLLPEPGDS